MVDLAAFLGQGILTTIFDAKAIFGNNAFNLIVYSSLFLPFSRIFVKILIGNLIFSVTRYLLTEREELKGRTTLVIRTNF